MNIEAKLIEKFDTQKITDTFQKREFVVEYAENPQYPELVKFELIQTNCDQLDHHNIGDQLNVSFNLKGRKWTDKANEVKYFTSLQAWRIENKSNTPTPPATKQEATKQEWSQDSFSADDDLPF